MKIFLCGEVVCETLNQNLDSTESTINDVDFDNNEINTFIKTNLKYGISALRISYPSTPNAALFSLIRQIKSNFPKIVLIFSSGSFIDINDTILNKENLYYLKNAGISVVEYDCDINKLNIDDIDVLYSTLSEIGLRLSVRFTSMQSLKTYIPMLKILRKVSVHGVFLDMQTSHNAKDSLEYMLDLSLLCVEMLSGAVIMLRVFNQEFEDSITQGSLHLIQDSNQSSSIAFYGLQFGINTLLVSSQNEMIESIAFLRDKGFKIGHFITDRRCKV